MNENILISGPPLCGKTTVVQKLATLLPEPTGFLTGEIRESGIRKGFRLIDIATGQERVLAHINIKGPHRVGKYGVDVEGFESFLDRLDLGASVVIIDEIGKMECLSPKFRTFIESLLRFDTSVIATIAEHGTPFIESLKRLPGSRLFRISPENRDFLPEKLARDILGQEDIFSS